MVCQDLVLSVFSGEEWGKAEQKKQVAEPHGSA